MNLKHRGTGTVHAPSTVGFGDGIRSFTFCRPYTGSYELCETDEDVTCNQCIKAKATELPPIEPIEPKPKTKPRSGSEKRNAGTLHGVGLHRPSSFRIPDEIKEPAIERAEREGVSLTYIVNYALGLYVEGKLPLGL